MAHPHVKVQDQEGYLGCTGPPKEHAVLAPYLVPKPRALVLEREVITTARCENLKKFCLDEMEGSRRPRYPLKRPADGFTCSQPLALSSREGTAAQKVPETYEEKLNCLHSG